MISPAELLRSDEPVRHSEGIPVTGDTLLRLEKRDLALADSSMGAILDNVLRVVTDHARRIFGLRP